MAPRGKRVADSGGGGKIRSSNGGSKKQINWLWGCLVLENRLGPGVQGEEGGERRSS